MAFNKTSSFKQMIKGLPFWLLIAGICIAFLIFNGQYSGVLGFSAIIVFGWGISFLSWSRMADIELHDEFFLVITFFGKTSINYNDVEIHNLSRYPRPLMFILDCGKMKLKLAYTNENYSRIKQLLEKTDSKFDIAQFDVLLNHYTMKPF